MIQKIVETLEHGSNAYFILDALLMVILVIVANISIYKALKKRIKKKK